MVGFMELFHAQNWAITYACTAAQSEHCYPLESLNIQQENIAVNDSKFNDFIRELSPGIVLYDRFMVEEQFSWRVDKYCPDAVTILETSDLHCLRKARQTALQQNREFTKTDLLSDVTYREIASIQRTDLSLIISSYEMELLTDTFKVDKALLHYYPFIVDAQKATDDASNWPRYEQRQGFMCIGNFKHPPNWDSVQYLKQTIWPLIRQQLPNAELFVYGAYPPAKAMQLHKPAEGFYLKGRADDAKKAMQSAKVCLAPLRFGAGLKGKLLEAMEYGTPSVTSTIGAESMHDDLPWNGDICDQPSAFAKAAVALYVNKEHWQRKQSNGHKILQQCYSPKPFNKPLLDKLDAIKGDIESHRLQNFQGQLLKHHTIRSTKYMSLWIEEKTKA
jgi:hypothetical protein